MRLSQFPLRLSLFVGFLLAALSLMISLGIAAWAIIDVATGAKLTTPGFRTFALALILFGVLMFFLGINGEYLARTFERTSGHKAYTIGRTTDEASR